MSTVPPVELPSQRQSALLSDAWVVGVSRVALAVAFVATWEWGARRLGLLFLAGPWEVLLRLAEISRSGQLWTDVRATLSATVAGFAIGWGVGTLLPFVLARSTRATRAIEPYIIASMGIPKFALAPLLVLWFGIGLAPKVVIVAFMVFYMVFINTFAGLRSVDRRLVDMARVAGANDRQVALQVVWPWMQPFVFTALKVALPRALSAAIVGEFLVADRGLGHYIEYSRQTGDTVGVFTGITVVTVLVLIMNAGLEALERRKLAWRPTVASGL